MSIGGLANPTRGNRRTVAECGPAKPETRLFVDSDYVDVPSGSRVEDIEPTHRLMRDVQAGTFDEGGMTRPFGAHRQSGHARDKCIDALLSYAQTGPAWIRLG